jgi:hypothetical protein
MDTVTDEAKWNYIQFLIKTKEGRKRGEIYQTKSINKKITSRYQSSTSIVTFTLSVKV